MKQKVGNMMNIKTDMDIKQHISQLENQIEKLKQLQE